MLLPHLGFTGTIAISISAPYSGTPSIQGEGFQQVPLGLTDVLQVRCSCKPTRNHCSRRC